MPLSLHIQSAGFRPLFPKQLEVLEACYDHTYVVQTGGMGTGKSTLDAITLFEWTTVWPGGHWAVIGPNVKSLKQGVLKKLEEFSEWAGLRYLDRSGGYDAHVVFNGCRIEIYTAGADGRLGTILSSEYSGIIVDEAKFVHPEFLTGAATRLRYPVGPRCMLMTTNPDGPVHPFKMNWLDRADALKLASFHITTDENPYLEPEIKAQYRALYPEGTPEFEQYFMGRWVGSEGVIFKTWYCSECDLLGALCRCKPGPIPDTWRQVAAGIDFGTESPTAAVYGHDSTIVGEYYAPGEDASVHAAAIQGSWAIEQAHIDWGGGGTVLRGELQKLGVRTQDAQKSLDQGLNTLRLVLAQGKVKIHPNCVNLRRELLSYVWGKPGADGRERPAPNQQDHAVDALRYLVMARFGMMTSAEWLAGLGV